MTVLNNAGGGGRRFGISLIRDARWMTPERTAAYRNIMLIAPVLSIAAWIGLARNGIDLFGRPIGTDFVSFWTASRVALSGHFADAYDIDLHWAAQKSLFPESSMGYEAFFYPPVFLLICLPLGFLPYFWSLGVWLLATGFACWRALRRLAGDQLPWLTFFAFPAVYLNALFGQNGFLTTALYAGAVIALERRPVLAGVCLGALVFKPHLLVMTPLALVFGRRWTTLAVAGVTAATLCLVSAAVLGVDVWRGFLAHAGLARATLEQNLVGAAKMQSVYAAMQLFGAPTASSYAAQIVSALTAGAILAVVCWRAPAGEGVGAAMLTATLLTTPFLLGYDLMLLAIPMIWVLKQARATGFRPWEKAALMAGFLLPMISSAAAQHLSLPLAPPVIAGLFAVVVRRLLTPCARESVQPVREAIRV